MQSLSRVSSLQTTYTDAQVTQILLNQNNEEQWFFDQLDAGFNWKGDLSPFITYKTNAPKISHDSNAIVKRSLGLTIRGDSSLSETNFLSDLIRVRYQLKAPDGGFLEWVLGTFTLTPFDQDIFPGWTWNTLKIPDLGQLLVDATFTSPYAVAAGINYVSAIKTIVSSYGGNTPISVNIPDTLKVLPASLGWDSGITRLQAINDLLSAINYFQAWFDETGTLRSSPIPDYYYVNPSFKFDNTSNSSIVMIPIRERPDISKVYNQVVVIAEDPRRNKIKTSFINNNPNDPISTVNWHPKTLTIRDSKIVDTSTANARARTEAQQASRIFGKKSITSFPWALSQDRDVYELIYKTTDEGLQDSLYVETKWDHVCKAGNPSTHFLEKIIKL